MGTPRVLVVLDYFLPGFKGGGSVRTVANIVERLGDEFDFHVVTRDRDIGDPAPYRGIEPGWTRRSGYRVRYLAPEEITPWGVARAVRPWRYDLLYLNSLFSTINVLFLLLRRSGRIPSTPVVLAPRGELAEQALALKATKKTVYLTAVRRLGMVRGINWQASNEEEEADIQRSFGGPVTVAMDVPPTGETADHPTPPKTPGTARFVFLSRLDRKKNLAMAIELVAAAAGDVLLDIYGNRYDEPYCRRCETLIAELPGGARCSFKGPLAHEDVLATLSGYHFFLLPTLNENFGHVILEALSAGLPLLISDQTPWVALERRGIGFELPLDDRSAFDAGMRRCIDMDESSYRRMSESAVAAARACMRDESPLHQTRRLLRSALDGHAS